MWRKLARFTVLQLYTQGIIPLYAMHGMLGGTQSRSGRRGDEKKFLPLPGIEARPSSPKPISDYIKLYRFPHC